MAQQFAEQYDLHTKEGRAGYARAFRAKRKVDGPVIHKSTEELFWEKVRKTDTCWVWVAGLENGYGRFFSNGRHHMAYRFAYELLVGPIPSGLTLDHLCRVPACVNPAHLEPVSLRVNVLRGTSPVARNAVKTHCKQGHLYDDANTIRYPDGRRWCRQCARAQRREWKRRRKAA